MNKRKFVVATRHIAVIRRQRRSVIAGCGDRQDEVHGCKASSAAFLITDETDPLTEKAFSQSSEIAIGGQLSVSDFGDVINPDRICI